MTKKITIETHSRAAQRSIIAYLQRHRYPFSQEQITFRPDEPEYDIVPEIVIFRVIVDTSKLAPYQRAALTSFFLSHPVRFLYEVTNNQPLK